MKKRITVCIHILDPDQTLLWNLEDCIQKTYEQLGKLVYSKKTGEFSVPNDIQDLAYSKNIRKKKKIVVFV
jgi:hypothetical protein